MSTESARTLLDDLLAELRGAGHVLVGTHQNPDGDALGSALGFSFLLDKLGVSHEVLCHHSAPKNLRFLPGIERLSTEWSGHKADLAVVLDLEAMDRLGSLREAFEAVDRLVVIDHHVPHKSPGTLRIVDTSSPATAAILCSLFLDFDVEICPEAAECLLTGIVTDTGSFRFPNTTPQALALAGRLMELGASLARVSEEVYLRKEEAAIRVMALAVSRMQTAHSGRLAWTVLSKEMMESVGAGDEHTEGIVNELLSLETVEIAAFFREGLHGRYKGSLRSRGGLDVASAAQAFGGGGHKNAAGLTLEPPSSRIEAEVLPRLASLLKA